MAKMDAVSANLDTVLSGEGYVGVSIGGGTPEWMVYMGKSHLNG